MLGDAAPLVPKNPDGPLMVIEIGRVSTPHQDVENIEASYEDSERFLDQVYKGPRHVKRLGEQASGMLTERATIVEAEEEIATGAWDLVLMEDLSKAYRNPRYQYAFVQDCVDHETRLISVGDSLDTADPNWEVMMGATTLRHGLHIPDTRRRVRRTATHAFHGGGMVQKVKFGYRKVSKEDADSGRFGPKGLRIAKQCEATPVIQKLRELVHSGYGPQALSDWLTAEQISPGPYVTSGKWTARLVAALLRDPILSGKRTFRDVVHEPIFRTGKHRRRPNPNPEVEFSPELAHMTADEQTAMIRALDANRQQGSRESKKGRSHPLFNKV